MTTENLTLMKALGAKMNFLNQRQKIISQNIANSDTPNYKPKDLVPVDFSGVLENVMETQSVRAQSTTGEHLKAGGEIKDPRKDVIRKTYEVAPAGNAVILEEQLLLSGRTVMDYNLMTNLMEKQMNLLRTSLGQTR